MPRDSVFLAACARDHLDDRVPVWFMRQAGRSLPEYRLLREGVAMLDSCMRPELVTDDYSRSRLLRPTTTPGEGA